jgi:hypothetical protein
LFLGVGPRFPCPMSKYITCTRCESHLIELPHKPSHSSIAIRCECGARYRVNSVNAIDRVKLDDLNESSINSLKGVELASFIHRLTKAHSIYNKHFERLIQIATDKLNEET